MAKSKGKDIRGITIELGGDASGLLGEVIAVDKQLKETQAALRDTQRLLKLDPGNVELLTQKEIQLKDAISDTEEKLKALKDVAEDAQQQLAEGKITQEQFDALQREIVATEQDLKKLKDQMKDFGSVAAQQIAAAGQKVKDFGDKMSKAGTTLTKYVTAPIVGIGTAAMAAFNEVDEGLDIIVKKTGASGKALEDMEEAAKNLATSIPADFRTAGEAVGEVNTRFGLTGKALEDLSGKFIKFAELNDTSVSASIDSVQAAMAAFGVSGDRAGDVLDILNKAGQDTGTSLDKLAGDLTANATALREMGFNINSATGFLANLNKNGVDASAVMTGLRKALQNATKNGKSMDQALSSLTGKIRGAKSETKAMQIATELFGAKAAPSLVKAIREGRLSFDELANSIKDYGDNVDQTFENTLDPIDQFKTTLNELKIVGADLVNAAAPMIKGVAEGLKNMVSGLRSAWEGLSPQMQETIIKLAGVAAAVGPVLAVGGKLVSGIGSLMELAPKLVSGFQAVQGALSALWGVMAAHPVVAVIAALAALVAAFIHCWNNVEGFKEFFLNAWAAIVQGVNNAADWIKNAIDNIGQWFSNLGQNALNWGRDLINNFLGGLKQKWDDVKNWVLDKLDWVRSHIHFSEPDKGPLSDFHTYAPDMVKLFVQGLKDNQRLVEAQFEKTFGMPDMNAGTHAGGAPTTFTTPVNGEKPIEISFVIDGAKRWVYEANRQVSQQVGIILTD